MGNGPWYGGKGGYSDERDADDDDARARLDEIRARRRGESVVRAPEIQPQRTWADRLLDFFR